MSRKPYTRREYPGQLQTEIVLRALGEKGFKELIEAYRAACLRVSRTQPPTESQIRLANLVRDFGFAEAMKKTGLHEEDRTKVNNAVNRVARWNFLKKEEA